VRIGVRIGMRISMRIGEGSGQRLERGVVERRAASTLGVSGATVRRDLQALSSGKLLVRTHGGAVVRLVDTRDGASHLSEKRRIGSAAAGLVGDGAVVGFTGGTTTLEVARALAHRGDITFVTNAINIASELVGRPGLRLVVIGGIVRSSFELVGPAAEAMLANYHLDIAFIGVDGLTPQEGCTTHDEMEAQTDLAFLRRARRNIVVADSSKIGKVTFARIREGCSQPAVVGMAEGELAAGAAGPVGPAAAGLAAVSAVVVTGPAELPFSQADQDSCQ
jgi:DeoR family transcriptional regulator of aga operon